MSDIPLEVSLIMCAYTHERWSDLKQAIESVRSQTFQPCDIVLVVDHNPALFSKAQEAFPGVQVIENQEKRGLSGARNCGIDHCAGQVIAFIDEDAIAASDWIENLLSGYRNPRVIGVGGEVKPLWMVPPPDWFPEEFQWVVGCSYKGLPHAPGPVRNPIGCNMSFRREALIASGGFRSGIGRIGKLPVGCEETELAIRIKQRNPDSIFLYHPKAEVYHKVPEWRTRWSYYARRCYSEGLSKALVTQFVGSGEGLASERRYVTETLTKGVLASLGQAFFQGRPAGIKRAAAIVAGLSLTTAGYLAGISARHRNTYRD